MDSLPIRLALTAVAWLASIPAQAQALAEFPFGLEMTLEANRQAGSKRLPTLEIGEQGEVTLELWCKAAQGQFSVAGDSIIFVPGAQDNRACTPAQVALDDALLASLGQVTGWTRQGDFVTLSGPQTLRFRLNTN